MHEGYTLERPSTLSCPDCGGAMKKESVGSLLQYRCHIGHVLTGEAMLEAQFTLIEYRLGGCMALLSERAELCRQLSALERGEGRDDLLLEKAEREAIERARTIRELLESEWVQPHR